MVPRVEGSNPGLATYFISHHSTSSFSQSKSMKVSSEKKKRKAGVARRESKTGSWFRMLATSKYLTG